MFEPIVISADGDTLVSAVPQFTDGDRLSEQFPVGLHERCGGAISWIPTSATHHALACGRCHLRVVVRSEHVRPPHTYGMLRNVFHQFNHRLLTRR